MKYLLALLLLVISNVFSAEFEETLRLAKQGDIDAQYRLGIKYHRGKGVSVNKSESLKWFAEAAEKGHARAQRDLAWIYDNEYEMSIEALKWYTKAAEQGLAVAQSNLGYMYEKGRGAPENYALAFKWYKKAAEQGYTGGQIALADLYESGKGVPESLIKAYVWESMARTQDSIFEKRIDSIKNKMTKEQIAKGQELASKCWESKFKDCD
jgi:TPR repeat protein